MTGMNPGRHAVYGFMDLDPKTYRLQFTNFNSVKASTAWDYLSRKGLRSLVLNIPTTYPARDLVGVLISGFVAIDLKRATFPQSLVPYLEKLGYKLDVDTTTYAKGVGAFVDELWDALAKREEALWHLLTTEQWSLYIGVVTETDRLHHYLWAAIEDEAHPQHAFFKDYYRKVDTFLGRVWDRFGADTLFMIMSDHGFCEIRQEVYLNRWLQQEGYLSFSSPTPKHEDMTPETRAFNMDPARIYIHRKGVYARGGVEEAEAERLIEEIAGKLRALIIDGRPVIDKIWRKTELYSGHIWPRRRTSCCCPTGGSTSRARSPRRSWPGAACSPDAHPGRRRPVREPAAGQAGQAPHRRHRADAARPSRPGRAEGHGRGPAGLADRGKGGGGGEGGGGREREGEGGGEGGGGKWGGGGRGGKRGERRRGRGGRGGGRGGGRRGRGGGGRGEGGRGRGGGEGSLGGGGEGGGAVSQSGEPGGTRSGLRAGAAGGGVRSAARGRPRRRRCGPALEGHAADPAAGALGQHRLLEAQAHPRDLADGGGGERLHLAARFRGAALRDQRPGRLLQEDGGRGDLHARLDGVVGGGDDLAALDARGDGSRTRPTLSPGGGLLQLLVGGADDLDLRLDPAGATADRLVHA